VLRMRLSLNMLFHLHARVYGLQLDHCALCFD